MFQAPDFWHNMSMRISSVMEDIGVNERIVLKRRRTWVLRETLQTISDRLDGAKTSWYHFGSQTEGSTTLELHSDMDALTSSDSVNVIQDLSEWTRGSLNLLMIEDTAPGYCFLQVLYPHDPMPVTDVPDEHHAMYRGDRVIMKNTFSNRAMHDDYSKHGPAFTKTGRPGFLDQDHVIAHPCKSLPKTVGTWLEKQRRSKRISSNMKRYIENSKCYVVPVGRKDSEYEEYEWRISTSHAERCVMFNLNITQLQCYVIMKMFLKTFLAYPNTKSLSSFICKNILLLCLSCMIPDLWQPCNLLKLLTYCLQNLRRCVLLGHCPHFIIHGNNLLAMKMTPENRLWLLERLTLIIQTHGCAFLSLDIDDIGNRLSYKLSVVSEIVNTHNIKTPDAISIQISGEQTYFLAALIMGQCKILSQSVMSGSADLSNILKSLIYNHGSYLERAACVLLTPLMCATAGSIKASDDMKRCNLVTPETMAWLSLGLESDVASSRLKLASVLYCVGDFRRTELLLTETEEKYDGTVVEAVCGCCDIPGHIYMSETFQRCANIQNETVIRHITAFCVRFLPSEIRCIPKELHYEMFRSSNSDLPFRGRYDYWMDWALVDSLPFLYFLQYKTYGHLQKYDSQQRALTNFANSIFQTRNLGHRETALNLLGQCMVQENRHQEALHHYMMSLNIRPRNNAANLHICVLLSRKLRRKSSDYTFNKRKLTRKSRGFGYICISLFRLDYFI